jgi:hypothetical protein
LVSPWLPAVFRRSPLNLARAAGAGCPAPSDHGCSELATFNPSLGVVSVIYLAGHMHTVVSRNSPHRLAWAGARAPRCLRAP